MTALLTHDVGYLIAGAWVLGVGLAMLFAIALGNASARRERAQGRAWAERARRTRDGAADHTPGGAA